MQHSKKHQGKGIRRKKIKSSKKPAKHRNHGGKRNERHYGYKDHVMSDERTKITENYETTTASTHVSNVCAELISEETAAQTTELLADSGYYGQEISKKVRVKGISPE